MIFQERAQGVIDRIGDQIINPQLIAIGGSVLAFAAFSPDTSVSDVVHPNQTVANETQNLVNSSNLTQSQVCQTAALSAPRNLTGRYESYSIPNDTLYDVHISLPSIKKCDSTGHRKITVFQEKQELGYGLHPVLEWTANGESKSITTNKVTTASFVLRAAHQCWPRPIGGYGNLDKVNHAGARPAVKETWIPKKGSRVSITYNGKAAPACK